MGRLPFRVGDGDDGQGRVATCGDAVRFAVPLVKVIEEYTRANFQTDLIAGLTVGVILLPQAMAYAQLALLPPIYGLYTSVIPAIVYATLSQSHTMNLGTIALCGLLTADIIEEKTNDASVAGSDVAIEIALAVAFLTGVILLVIGALRLGDSVQRYLSPALVGGFHTGAAIHVMMSQLSHVLGVQRSSLSGPFHIPRKVVYYAQAIPDANWVTFGIALSAMLIIWLCKKVTLGRIRFGQGPLGVRLVSAQDAVRLRFPIPGELIVVIIFEIVSSAASLQSTHGVKVVGRQDTTVVSTRNLDWPLVGDLAQERYMEILTIAIITFALTLSDAKTYADETDRPFNGNREMTALSMANLISPFFGSYIAGAGISRSAVAFGIDQKRSLTQVYSIISAVVVLLVIPVVHVVKDLPQATLAAVVLMALHGMVLKQGRKFRSFWRYGRNDDFVTWIVTLCTTVFVDLDYGLLVGLLMTIHSVFLRLNQAKLCTLGRIADTANYDEVTKNGVSEFPGVKVIRLDSPLFFGSKDQFYREVRQQIDNHAKQAADRLHGPRSGSELLKASVAVTYHTLVIDATPTTFLDTAGAQQLGTLAKWLARNHRARLLVACGNEQFMAVFHKIGLDNGDYGDTVLFSTVHEAVLYGASHGISSHVEFVQQQTAGGHLDFSAVPKIRVGSVPDLASQVSTPRRQRGRGRNTVVDPSTPLLGSTGSAGFDNPAFSPHDDSPARSRPSSGPQSPPPPGRPASASPVTPSSRWAANVARVSEFGKTDW